MVTIKNDTTLDADMESNEVDQHEVVTDGLMQEFENEGGDDMNMYRSGAIESMQVSETDSDHGEDD